MPCSSFQVIHLSGEHRDPITEYVGLRTDILTPFDEAEGSLYDLVWNSPQMSDSLGIVALPESFIQAKSLPLSMRFPWDHSKGTAELGHLAHCLNVLREDTLCHADDTPRYAGHLHAEANASHPVSGIGQLRKCRDFGKLFDFAMEHSACYVPVGDDAPVEDNYKGCPDGRVLWD
ncbi:hypothetical protein MMC17_005848 [Xylographa soralifera]|nr:hypothetical protein [Xylographa soralifera]